MANQVDPTERIENLILYLSGTNPKKARTLEEIKLEIPGYDGADSAVRQKFERDKRTLRMMQIEVEAVPVDGPSQYAYWIDENKLYLDLSLTEDEQRALAFAVAAVHPGDASGADALLKMSVGVPASAPAINAVGIDENVPLLYNASTKHATATFTHAGKERVVCPLRLELRKGHWYVSAWSEEHGEARVFRVDRIENEVVVGEDGSAVVPEGTRGADVGPLADPGEDEALLATVRVDAFQATRFLREAGDIEGVVTHEDGSIMVPLHYSSSLLLRTWLMTYLDHVVVEEPKALREEIVEWLHATSSGAYPDRLDDAVPTTANLSAAVEADEPSGRQRMGQGEKLQRLMAILGYLAQQGYCEISELAKRFEMDRSEVLEELQRAACYGVPPYDPGDLLMIIVDDDHVSAQLPEKMGRPRRLTANEAVGVLAAAKTLLAISGGAEISTLASAVAKLEDAIGAQGKLDVSLTNPEFLPEVQAAIAGQQRVEVDYYVTSRDQESTRVLDPIQLLTHNGSYYVRAFCHLRGDVRNFLVDSIERLEVLGTQSEHPTDVKVLTDAEVFDGNGASEVVIEVDDEGSWLCDTVPTLSVERHPDGTATVVVAVVGTAWLERILLQLGPHGRVVAPEAYLEVGPSAATRVLAQYA